MHRLDSICSSSVYGFVLRFAPERGQDAPRPSKTGPETGHFSGTFSPMNALWRRQFDIDENEAKLCELQILSS